MNCLRTAQDNLRQQLNQLNLTTVNASFIALQTQITGEVDLLAWLKAQTLYPQFYLNFREGNKKIASIGQVLDFSDPVVAQQFVNQQQLPLIGGMQFAGQSRFVLPELLLEQEAGQLRIYCCQKTFSKAKAFNELIDKLDKLTPLNPLPQNIQWQQSQWASQSKWCGWVEQAVARIKQGELNKVVLANENCFQLNQQIDAKDFLRQSEQQNWGCYHFLWAENSTTTFVGSTPERLFARTQDQFDSEALAGTALLGQNEDVDQKEGLWLLNDEKNLQENALVVEDIVHNVQPYVSQLQVSQVGLKPLRNVQHLIRKIRGKISAQNPLANAQILQAIHPTAAVSGLPQTRAKQVLSQIEQIDRSWYAGTLGWLSQKQAEFCVTIRSAFIEGKQIRIFAGAGIVEDSDPQVEWLEIERKAAGLISILQHHRGKNVD